jgi:uncharacterized protein (TIGR00369 family)
MNAMTSEHAVSERPRLRIATQQSGFSGLVGPFYEIEISQRMRRALQLETRHSNPEGVVHGGVVATFADYVLYRAIGDEISHDVTFATVQLSIQYLASARAGEWLFGEGIVLRKSRSLIFASGELFNENRPIAFATGIWKLIDAG